MILSCSMKSDESSQLLPFEACLDRSEFSFFKLRQTMVLCFGPKHLVSMFCSLSFSLKNIILVSRSNVINLGNKMS